MQTYRQLYFEIKKDNNIYFNDTVINEFLLYLSDFSSKEELFLHLDDFVKEYDVSIIERIKGGEPYQYVLGYAYFIGNKFIVDKSVLIPRQETEQLVLDLNKLINEKFKNNNLEILDLCSGSGVIGASLKLMNPDRNITFVDVSNNALNINKRNVEQYGFEATFLSMDLTKKYSLEKKYDVVVMNPPYIASETTVDEQTLKYEPHIALFAKPYTLFYENLFKQYNDVAKEKFILAFEIGEDMEEDLSGLIHAYFTDVFYEFKRDLYGKIRYLYIIKE